MDKYTDVKKVLIDTFFGPTKGGVYSPSVQSTLYDMAKAVLARLSIILAAPLSSVLYYYQHLCTSVTYF